MLCSKTIEKVTRMQDTGNHADISQCGVCADVLLDCRLTHYAVWYQSNMIMRGVLLVSDGLQMTVSGQDHVSRAS